MVLSRKLFFYPLLAFIAALSLTTCFSDYRGDIGTLVFSFQNPGYSRLIMDPGEVESFEHEIILKGPGGTFTRKITGYGVWFIELVPGSWYVKIRAIGETPVEYIEFFPETPTMLRAMGMKTVEVKAGQKTPVKIDMFSATEVTSWEQLSEVINILSEFLDEQRREGIIVVRGELFADKLIPIENLTVTIMAEGDDATISRGIDDYVEGTYGGSFFEISDGGKLILKGDYGAELIFDGENENSESYLPLLFLYHDGSLEMYDGAVLQNNYNQVNWEPGGAVYVGIVSEFTMHGGIIRNNTAYQGGGVYVQDEGIFTKTGGIIYGDDDDKWKNTADTGNGNAVLVQMKYYFDFFIKNRPERQKNSTAGRGINLNSENDKNWDK